MAEEKPQAAIYPTEIIDATNSAYKPTITYEQFMSGLRYRLSDTLIHGVNLDNHRIIAVYPNGEVDITS